MSDLMLRNLATACGPRIAEKVEQAVVATVREHLPAIIEGVLREQYPGETLRLYISKRPGAMRKVRDQAILAKYNGRNVKALSTEFGLSPRMIFKIISGRK